MMPQLGVLANIDKKDISDDARNAALEVFHKDCLIRLGTCITPVGKVKDSSIVLKASIKFPNGEKVLKEIKKNELIRIEAKFEPLDAELTPHKSMDIGAGKGETIKTKIFGGVVGLIFDGRERPITLPSNKEKRLSLLDGWSDALNEYPKKS